jgi:hypothetical protein
MHHADALVIGQPECQRVDVVPPCRRFDLGHQAASGSITLLRPFLHTVHRRTIYLQKRFLSLRTQNSSVHADDNYAIAAPMPNAPVYRSVCGGVWFHIDGASGAILERLDPSRRAYRWFYSALHTMDFPILSARPTLRSALVVIFCGFGLVFSLTGVRHRLAKIAAAILTMTANWAGPAANTVDPGYP